jgi:dTDP-4-amino-4,6-dideoxygalactose transaminase
MLQFFEEELANFLEIEIDNVCVFVNGTLALQLGLQALGIKGEVITTPFTFVATSHALWWNNITPVFVDIEPKYYTIDPQAVEAAITDQTTAILAVHIYGHPCRLDELERISRQYGLKLIYDAAQAFGVKVNGNSIAHHGDLSMFSFHATKLFHSIEGGMLCFHNSDLKKKLKYLKNFGFENEIEVVMPGTNAKMNEFQALMGRHVLRYLGHIVEKNRKISTWYRERLSDLQGVYFAPALPENCHYNYSYMPLEIDASEYGISRDTLYEKLMEYNVFTRRYFYPLLPDYTCYNGLTCNDPLVTAREKSSRILALPLYPDLKLEEVEKICEIIKFVGKTENR